MADHLWLFIDELVRENEDVLVADGGEFVQRGTGTKVRTALTIKEFRIRFIGPRQVPSLPIPPPPATLVDRFIRDAGGTRTLVVLKPGVHGKTVSLGLTRDLHPLLDIDTTDTPVVLCEVDLVSPPWEELL
jgi:hypothetical protein